jgi:uncharacterized protein YraI
MKPRLLMMATFLGAMLTAPGIAAAANAFTTGNVNMRAGPSTQYPRVATIPRGSTVDVYGCTAEWRWCDTSWRGIRGWVSASYLETMYRERRVYVPDYGPRIGVPVITFQFGSYWDRWYSDRPWYRDRHRWDRDWRDRDWRDRDWRDRRRVDRDRGRDRDWDDRDDRRARDVEIRRERRSTMPESDWAADRRGQRTICLPGLEGPGRC